MTTLNFIHTKVGNFGPVILYIVASYLLWKKNTSFYYFQVGLFTCAILNIVLKGLIYSLDTSSPVINGWVGNELGPHGLTVPKPKAKLADNLDIELSEEQINLIFKNIKTFRSYVSK